MANENFVTQPPFPKRIMLEVSSICNHACIFCSSAKSNRKKRIIDRDLAVKVIRDAYEEGCREISFHAMGEPLLCKDLKDYVQYCHDLGYEYIYIDTNGAMATPEVINPVIGAGLNSIKFSIAAADAETYSIVHGRNDFDKVIENLKNLSNYRKANALDFKLFVDFVETKYTVGQYEQLRTMVEGYVDDVWFSPCMNQAGEMVLESKELNVGGTENVLCKDPFGRIIITSDGLVTACCMDNNNSLAYGDVQKDDLSQIWESEAAQQIRMQHITGENINKKCDECDLCLWYQVKDRM